MGRTYQMNLQWPRGGLVRATAIQSQPPYTTPDCRNVRPRDVQQSRTRGGSRAGLLRAFPERVGSGGPVRLLAQVPVSKADGLTVLNDNFQGTALGTAWSVASWLTAPAMPKVTADLSGTLTVQAEGGAVHTALDDFDTSQLYRVGLFIQPYEGAHHGRYRLYARMATSSPNASTGGVTAELVLSGDTGTYSGSLAVGSGSTYVFTGGSDGGALPGWFEMAITGDTITCTWRGTQMLSQTVAAAAGPRVGFSLKCETAGGACLVSEWRATYFKNTMATVLRPMLVASADGAFARELTPGHLTAMGSPGVTLTSVKLLQAAVRVGKVYIADTTLAVYDAAADTLTAWTAAKGTLPEACTMVATYRDRLVLAGGQSWYMTRQGDPTDFDYGAVDSDAQRAVAGVVSEAGLVGEPIRALIPGSDDYLVFGCANSLWVLRGDPAYGGRIDSLSRTVGILDASAWCHGPAGEIVFLAQDGLRLIGPGAAGGVVEVSQGRLPVELRDVDPASTTITLAWDARWRGVHVYLTPTSGDAGQHWWWDWDDKGFWLDSYPAVQQPTAVVTYQGVAASDNASLAGGRDGYVRKFAAASETDDGTTISSYAVMGPLALGGSMMNRGRLVKLVGVLGHDSGPVVVRVSTGYDAEAALQATRVASTTWNERGRQRHFRPHAVGVAGYVRLTGSRAWNFEGAIIEGERTGEATL